MKSYQPPVIPQSWGNRKKIGDTPNTPAGEISPAPLLQGHQIPSLTAVSHCDNILQVLVEFIDFYRFSVLILVWIRE
jgi:hypothetical protein